ncbi:MAG: hypothetical protein ACTSPB_05080 [Candidatus Thorarchaeota archaeon]
MSIFDVDKYFIVKDWGINPYDPDSTWDGLKSLQLKELMRLAKSLTDVDGGMKSNYESYKEKDSYAKRDTLVGWIMGLIYFNDVNYFHDKLSSPKGFLAPSHPFVMSFVEYFVLNYQRPTQILNCSDAFLVSMMRRYGGGKWIIAHKKYGDA